MHKNENTQNSHSFLALAFFRGICLSRHQRIWNQHKILRFLDILIYWYFSKKFWGHNSTFCNLKMQMRKKLYIFEHFAKSKNLFFCQYLSFSVWFPLSLKHWRPLPPPLSPMAEFMWFSASSAKSEDGLYLGAQKCCSWIRTAFVIMYEFELKW